jgi:hypothetical protein
MKTILLITNKESGEVQPYSTLPVFFRDFPQYEKRVDLINQLILTTMRLHFYRKDNDSEAEVVSISHAKLLLKKQGGIAWTEHYDRDGGMFEATPIELKNNAGIAYNVKYNVHL